LVESWGAVKKQKPFGVYRRAFAQNNLIERLKKTSHQTVLQPLRQTGGGQQQQQLDGCANVDFMLQT
jgi:hypothetical protein